jgi:serine/threonine protein phosphatase 1
MRGAACDHNDRAMFSLGPAAPGLLATARFDRPVAVIGDVHGQSDLLRRLLDRLPADMPILCMGDYGDRGPDTRGVMDTLIARGARGVRGNHEEWLLAWLRGEGFDAFALMPGMGGVATLASYGITSRDPRVIGAQADRVPAAHRDWLLALPLVIDLEVCGVPYWMIHAGVPSTVGLRGLTPPQVVPWLVEHRPETLLWPKSDPTEMLPVDRTVIMGHLRLPEPYDGGSVLAIDTGAGTNRSGRLTAVILPERRFVQVG